MRIPAITLTAALLAIPAIAQTEITGAGSSFAAPLYAKWAEAAEPAIHVSLNYQAIGSAAGINQINNRTVDFGASDMPVNPAALAAHRQMQFPTAIGGIDIVVNLPGVTANQLRLTGEILAGIYLGRITKWNDPAIAAINPDLALPRFAIAPVYRADGSGTTFVFTDYLALQSPQWREQVGAATSVGWPAGAGAKGNDGVAGTVRTVRGGIGYVEAAFSEQNRLVTARLRNRAGRFVAPTPETLAAAAAAADWQAAPGLAINLNDQPGEESWPIESATFVIVPLNAPDRAHTRAVLALFDWAFTHGDPIARRLLYIPLPDAVKQAIRAEWAARFPP